MNQKLLHAAKEFFSQGLFIFVACFFYFNLPYFQNLLQPEAKTIITYLAEGFAILGFPYFAIRNFFWPKYLESEGKSVIALRAILVGIQHLNPLFTLTPTMPNFLSFSISPKSRTALLSVIVKFFYLPLMISFLIGNVTILQNIFTQKPGNFFTYATFSNWTYYVLYNLIFVIDTACFTFGYIVEAKWLKNEIKSVDPYLSGWVVTLICYPPFNNIVDTVTQSSGTPFNYYSPFVMSIFLVMTLLLYSFYVWASIALGTKASNLTNRGIVTSGPYKYIRHPAYAAKNLAWWFERVPFMTSWVGIVSLVVWNTIYIARAFTEERHLLADPDYKEYVKKVPWRFIPYVI